MLLLLLLCIYIVWIFFSFSLTALGSFNGIHIFIEPMSFNARFTQLWYLVCIFSLEVSEISKKFLFTLIFHVYDLDAGSTLLWQHICQIVTSFIICSRSKIDQIKNILYLVARWWNTTIFRWNEWIHITLSTTEKMEFLLNWKGEISS